jgi:hypothetical protein
MHNFQHSPKSHHLVAVFLDVVGLKSRSKFTLVLVVIGTIATGILNGVSNAIFFEFFDSTDFVF